MIQLCSTKCSLFSAVLTLTPRYGWWDCETMPVAIFWCRTSWIQLYLDCRAANKVLQKKGGKVTKQWPILDYSNGTNNNYNSNSLVTGIEKSEFILEWNRILRRNLFNFVHFTFLHGIPVAVWEISHYLNSHRPMLLRYEPRFLFSFFNIPFE